MNEKKFQFRDRLLIMKFCKKKFIKKEKKSYEEKYYVVGKEEVFFLKIVLNRKKSWVNIDTSW